MSDAVRSIVLWCPDWPVNAAIRAGGLDADEPIALVEHGIVFACSASARADGVTRGLKVREAQARCTRLRVLDYDPMHDARAFEAVLAGIEQVSPGVQPMRPGTCAIRARGPARYYGGEHRAAAALLAALDGLGISDGRVGIADGTFAAEQAARHSGTEHSGTERIGVVAPGASAAFLAPMRIRVLIDDGHDGALAVLLERLGVHTIGEFAALPAMDVQRRFGAVGAHAHAIAGGYDRRVVVPRTPPREVTAEVAFEPALDRVDQVAFGVRAEADRFIAELTGMRLVCTGIRVEIVTESGVLSERSWLHPRWFTAADVLDRVRWQLQGAGASDSGLSSAIAAVRVLPERVDSTANHEEGLWGTGPDERVHHGLTRVQSMLGHEGVVTAAIGGGRMLAERQVLVPWGDAPPAERLRSAARPWPGSLPDLVPATVFRARHAVGVYADDTASGAVSIGVDARGMLTGEPRMFSPTGRAGDARPVEAWAGPWPLVERWWDAAAARRVHRMQLVDEGGDAWLLVLDDDGWQAEARYD